MLRLMLILIRRGLHTLIMHQNDHRIKWFENSGPPSVLDYSSRRLVLSPFLESLIYCRYRSVEESLLCPNTFDRKTIEIPCFRWWATKVCLKSFIFAFSIPALLKYRSIASLIFLTKKGLPVFVTKKWSFEPSGLEARYLFNASFARLLSGTALSGCPSLGLTLRTLSETSSILILASSPILIP